MAKKVKRKKGKAPRRKLKGPRPLPPPLEPQERDETDFEDIPDEIYHEVKREAERKKKKEMKRKARPKGLLKARAAGILLILVMLLGVLNALVVIWVGIQVQTPGEILSETTGNIHGRVTDTSGIGLEGAEVTVIGTHYNAFSNAEGWYFIQSVPVDVYKVQVDKANFTSMIKKFKVEENMPRPLNFQLDMGAGVSSVQTNIPGQQEPLQPSYAWSVVIGIFASVMAGVAGLFAFKRSRYRLALVGAGIGILSYGFIAGTFLCIMALIILVLARPAFVPSHIYTRRLFLPTDDPGEMPFEGTKVDRPGRPPRPKKVKVKKAEAKTLDSRKADQDIDADEGEARPPPEEEPVMDAEVREDLKDKAMESEGAVDDPEGELPMKKGKKEIKEAGPDIVKDMEKALQETLESPEETETDIISSVLQKLDIDKPQEPVKPPKKKKMKKRGLKKHQERALCRICVKPIIIASDAVYCKCGREYHVHCAKDIGRCKNCGRRLKTD